MLTGLNDLQLDVWRSPWACLISRACWKTCLNKNYFKTDIHGLAHLKNSRKNEFHWLTGNLTFCHLFIASQQIVLLALFISVRYNTKFTVLFCRKMLHEMKHKVFTGIIWKTWTCICHPLPISTVKQGYMPLACVVLENTII